MKPFNSGGLKTVIVKRAKVLGYCMGVRRAVDSVLNAAGISDNGLPLKRRQFTETENKKTYSKVFTFGPLIHNPATLEYLARNGIDFIEPEKFSDDEDYGNTKVVIRAHGVSPEQLRKIKKAGAEVIDATCPRVVSSQTRAKKYAKDSLIILAGDKNHGELIGIAGYVYSETRSACIIVQNAEEAKSVNLPDLKGNLTRAVLIAQTTIKQSEYDAIAQILKMRLPDLIVLNTICPATSERQEALKELASETEAILVIGGKNSANTKRLLQTAIDLKKTAWLVENAKELPKEIFNYGSVGITAGASTPDFVIEEIESILTGKTEKVKL